MKIVNMTLAIHDAHDICAVHKARRDIAMLYSELAQSYGAGVRSIRSSTSDPPPSSQTVRYGTFGDAETGREQT